MCQRHNLAAEPQRTAGGRFSAAGRAAAVSLLVAAVGGAVASGRAGAAVAQLRAQLLPLMVSALDAVHRLGGVKGALLLLGLQVGGFLAMVPTSPLSVAAGCAFGLPVGLPVAGGAYLVACVAPFAVSRLLLTARFSEWLLRYPIAATYMTAVEERPFLVTTLLRLSPALPSSINCYMLGLTTIPLKTYLAATLVGAAPNCAFCVYVGSMLTAVPDVIGGTGKAPPLPLLVLSFVATAAVLVLLTTIARKQMSTLAKAHAS